MTSPLGVGGGGGWAVSSVGYFHKQDQPPQKNLLQTNMSGPLKTSQVTITDLFRAHLESMDEMNTKYWQTLSF